MTSLVEQAEHAGYMKGVADNALNLEFDSYGSLN